MGIKKYLTQFNMRSVNFFFNFLNLESYNYFVSSICGNLKLVKFLLSCGRNIYHAIDCAAFLFFWLLCKILIMQPTRRKAVLNGCNQLRELDIILLIYKFISGSARNPFGIITPCRLWNPPPVKFCRRRSKLLLDDRRIG